MSAHSAGLNSFGYAVTRPPSVGSRACSKRSRLPRWIVSFLLGWRVSVLTPTIVANFLRINIYLTQKITDDMLWNIAVNDAGAEYDPLTLLRTRTMYGRPDWKAIYGRIRMAIEAGSYLPGHGSALKSRVGVRVHIRRSCRSLIFLIGQTYFCGVSSYLPSTWFIPLILCQPNGLAKAVRDAALAENSSSVKFTFAKVRGTLFEQSFTLRIVLYRNISE